MFKKTNGLLSLMFFGVVFLSALPAPAMAATENLPDLQMGKLTDISIQRTGDGRRLLRFTARIINMGAVPFEIEHVRPTNTSTDWTHTQYVNNIDGTITAYPVSGFSMIFAGDGHNHWHISGLESYTLDRLDNGQRVGLGQKNGFCFFDNYNFTSKLPGHPASVVYNYCGRDYDTKFTMGLSVGWGDEYNAKLPDQYIDVTDLTAGRYRLTATADANKWFKETNTNNNATWVDIQLQGGGVKIVGYGPYPLP